MPRCFIDAVRGYRRGDFWGHHGHEEVENIMRTRSGLQIKTVPAITKFRSNPARNGVPSSNRPNAPARVENIKVPKQCKNYSMNALPFVTRFYLIQRGTDLELTGVPNNSEDWPSDIVYFHTNEDSDDDDLSVDMGWENDVEAQDSEAENSNYALIPSEDISFPRPDQHFIKVSISPSKTSDAIRSKFKEIRSCVVKGNERSIGFSTRREKKTEIRYKEGTSAFTDLTSTATEDKTVKPPTPSAWKIQEEFSAGSGQCLKKIYLSRSTSVNHLQKCVVLKLVSSQSLVTGQSASEALKLMAKQVSSGNTDSRSSTQPGNPVAIPRPSEMLESSSSVKPEDNSSSSQDAQEEEEDDTDDLKELQESSYACFLDARGNQIHKCTLCGKVFTVYAAFKSHVSTHLRQRNRCPVCKKSFSRSWLLKGHMRTHTGERPYKCPHPGCDKAFADKSNLRSHNLIHTVTSKNYVCTKCGRAFAQKRYLHKHKLEVCKI